MGLLVPSADAMLVALAIIATVTIVPLALRVRIVDLSDAERQGALRRAAPIGLVALATVAYYRSGTIALAVLSDERATAAFGVAAALAFGLLMLPNAITTPSSPDLPPSQAAGESSSALARHSPGRPHLPLPWRLRAPSSCRYPVALGPSTTNARPFASSASGLPLIAASGVIGTALLASDASACSPSRSAVLAVNLLCIAMLVPVAGAVGAAFATLACELVGLVVLLHVARRALPGLVLPGRSERSHIAPTTAIRSDRTVNEPCVRADKQSVADA